MSAPGKHLYCLVSDWLRSVGVFDSGDGFFYAAYAEKQNSRLILHHESSRVVFVGAFPYSLHNGDALGPAWLAQGERDLDPRWRQRWATACVTQGDATAGVQHAIASQSLDVIGSC